MPDCDHSQCFNEPMPQGLVISWGSASGFLLVTRSQGTPSLACLHPDIQPSGASCRRNGLALPLEHAGLDLPDAARVKPLVEVTVEIRLRPVQNQQLEDAGTLEKTLWAVPLPIPVSRQIVPQESFWGA